MTQWNSSYYRSKNYNRVIKGSIDSLINEIPFLPVEEEICSQFLESIEKDNSSLPDLAKYIALSPSLTFNVLNLVQSPFNKSNNISGLNDALKTIGNDIVLPLVKDFLVGSSSSIEGAVLKPCITSPYYGSLKSAHLAALVSDELDLLSPFAAYVAALLHNIGAVALASKFPTQYNRLETSSGSNNAELLAAEDHMLGVNHCFIGARMVEHWCSFPFIADAIYYHHHPIDKIKQASNLVRLVCFSSMVDNSGATDTSQIIEAGRELFSFTDSQVDEYISIAELKVQNRLLHLGIELSDDNREIKYQPGYQRERINFNRSEYNSLLSVLIDNFDTSVNKKDILNQLGKSIHVLTGLSEIYYFEYNEDNNSLDGISLRDPEYSDNFYDFSIPIDAKSSIIVTAFLMGVDINSLDRVSNIEPALFDLQMINHMGTDGLYCMPLLNKDRAAGIIVLGIDLGKITIEKETIKKLHDFAETIIPFLYKDKATVKSETADEKNIGADSLQTRKLIHEINNPLSAIKNYLKVLNMKLDDIDVENDEIRIIDSELNRIAKLLKEFKSSPSEIREVKTASSVNNIISDTILLVENSRMNVLPINIDFEMDENIPDIRIDKDAFRQVLINLINNSIEAMPKGGNISVSAMYKNGLEQGNTQTVDSEDNGKRIEISIADDGPGFPDNLRSNLFKNQSTTKADHDGLGLLIVHELVKKMGGNITLDDQIDKGARFKITLPAD